MKTLNQQIMNYTALAVLSASTQTSANLAILGGNAFEVSDHGLVQLLPAGHFQAVDGRPNDVAGNQWLMDKAAFEQLKANTPHQIGDLVIDYEHQTLKTEQNGQPAIAAGYFNIGDVHFIEGKGLFIKPRWTSKAQAHLSSGEYKYISAVFGYDTLTGRPTFLHSAGLVNRPGVDGMAPLAQLAASLHFKNSNITQQEDAAVNEILLAILKALGIKIEGELPSDVASLKAFETEALTALSALNAKADQVPTLNQQIVALKANSNPDPSEYVPVAAVTELQQNLAALQAQVNGSEVDKIVEQGKAAGKIIASMEDWARELGNKDVTQLKAFLDATPAIAALKSQQSDKTNLDDARNNDVVALSAEDKEAATLLGMTEKEFADQKALEQGAK